jgi:UDP-2-acetamido-3-amino-2,3-dideoxy-glucuronate N-acetyltransferase
MTCKPTPLQKIRDVEIGARTWICDFVNLYECRIGDDTKIGPFVEIQRNASIGDRCKISSHTFISENVSIEDEVFIGHGVLFINETHEAKSTPADPTAPRIRVKKGAFVGSGAIITSAVTIGEKARVGAGAVVIEDVPDGATVVGNPSRMMASER